MKYKKSAFFMFVGLLDHKRLSLAGTLPLHEKDKWSHGLAN